jgi:hypothetical protein
VDGDEEILPGATHRFGCPQQNLLPASWRAACDGCPYLRCSYQNIVMLCNDVAPSTHFNSD